VSVAFCSEHRLMLPNILEKYDNNPLRSENREINLHSADIKSAV